jgi:hypothetical protein
MNKRVAAVLAIGVFLYLAGLVTGFADVIKKHRPAAVFYSCSVCHSGLPCA